MNRTKVPAEHAPEMGITVGCNVHFRTAAKGRKRLREGDAPPPEPVDPGRVSHIARLLALAHRCAGLLRSGEVKDYASLARIAGVTRPRVTQIMNLLHLAPDIQEAVLDLPLTVEGRDPICERDVRPIASAAEWSKQRQLWRNLTGLVEKGTDTAMPSRL